MAGTVRLLVVFLLLITGAFAQTSSAAQVVRLPDLDNKLVNPFESVAATSGTVFVFTSVDCPISNRYAPEIKRLHDAFASRGIAFWLVYPNPRESATQVRAHLKDFGYPIPALRDPSHELAKLAKATVTPEAAVYDRRGTLVYHGRIDDRYVSLGVERPAATRHDLQDALTAVVAGKSVPTPAQPGVGCFIADFVP
jgi:hypothetical protein